MTYRSNQRRMVDGVPVICSEVGCDISVHARGLCRKHYYYAYNRGQIVPAPKKVCVVEGCSQLAQSSDYCLKHYYNPAYVRPRRTLPAGVTSPAELGRMLGVTRQRAYQLLHPLKNRAREILNEFVAKGEVAPAPFCYRCGQEGEVQAHHWDYERPLDVGWFCSQCHGLIHAKSTDDDSDEEEFEGEPMAITTSEGLAPAVTVREAALMVGCSAKWLRKQIKAGKLPAHNLNIHKTRILVEDLKAWAEGRG